MDARLLQPYQEGRSELSCHCAPDGAVVAFAFVKASAVVVVAAAGEPSCFAFAVVAALAMTFAEGASEVRVGPTGPTGLVRAASDEVDEEPSWGGASAADAVEVAVVVAVAEAVAYGVAAAASG